MPCSRLLAARFCVALLVSATAASAAPQHVIYAPVPVAAALGSVPGALIQGPAARSASWPIDRQMTKVKAAELRGRSAQAMTIILRRAIRARPGAGVVGVDELSSGWSEHSAARLGVALKALGAERERVVLYAAASTVGGVGRVDPRRRLSTRNAALVRAASHGGALYLETYYGSREPIGASELATWLTRWRARWPGEASRLRLLLGPPAAGVSQRQVWVRARRSHAGRALLRNGAGVYGLRGTVEARDWLDGLRAFQRAPFDAPRGGDARVAVGGGLALRSAPGGFVVSLSRPARVVIQLLRVGASDGRVFRKLQGPFRATRVPLPRDTRPGRYVARAIAIGDGIRDEARVSVRVGRRSSDRRGHERTGVTKHLARGGAPGARSVTLKD